MLSAFNWNEFGKDAFMSLYTLMLIVVSLYGLHRYVLVFLWWKHKHKRPTPGEKFEKLPHVTIQLPMFNERFVAQRIVRETCEIDYPKELLHIQLLDDSTDDTVEIAREAAEEARAKGFDVEFIHREDRTGFKAGALVNGMKTAKGEFTAIFDADFKPQKDFLKNTIHYFTDPKVCVVQTRWEHLNRDDSLLTKAQAIFLDGHFAIEHVSRNCSGRFMSFNGTGGIWRNKAIEDAGGWHHDTLTEDLDLSYRAQLRGWKFVFLPNETSPAELPPEMMAFKAQQFRWTKGGAQNCKKLLPMIIKSDLPLKVKGECFFHLTGFCMHIFMFLFVLMMFPAMYLKTRPGGSGLLGCVIDVGVFTLATMSASVFYCAGQGSLFGKWRRPMRYMPMMMGIGVGLCVSNTKAIIEAFMGKESAFIRTPKYGEGQIKAYADETEMKPRKKKSSSRTWVLAGELTMGLYMVFCLVCALLRCDKTFVIIPFLLIFAFGFFYVALMDYRAMRAPKMDIPADAEVALAGE